MIEGKAIEAGQAFDLIRSSALSLPEAIEEFPWGESAIKVRKKTFVYLWRKEERVTLSLKLMSSYEFGLLHPFVNTMGPTLKQGGWIQCRFEAGDNGPPDMVQDWVLQSYCTVAPKRLANHLLETS